ncbi:hypothetical protein J3Q64DRAFT_1453110 [Phycomyces blakesleeanus]|uniref:Uncharacterized protein n=1 Tax=Phycomyces blakesleeanus TaxID=4837 RepID=A0ABR3B1D3_PHYBL
MWIPFSLTRLDSTQLNLPHLTSYHPALPCLTFVLTRNGSFHLTSPHLTLPYLTLPYLTVPYRTSMHLTSSNLFLCPVHKSQKKNTYKLIKSQCLGNQSSVYQKQQ